MKRDAFWDVTAGIEADAKALSQAKSRDYATDDVLSNFTRMAAMWGAYLRVPLTAANVADMMLLLKLDRMRNLEGRDATCESVRDSMLDAVNYLRLANGCRLEGRAEVPDEH